jgi:glycine betaine catabolism B
MKARVKRIIPETEGIRSFQLWMEKKPKYVPGQWTTITLPELKVPDPQGNKRDFSLSSSPTENFLQFTTKYSTSGYKQTLWKIEIDQEVEMRAISGNFVWQGNEPKLFIAGGMGITPFRSMWKYAKDKKLPADIKLLWSVKPNQEIFKSDVGGPETRITSERVSRELISKFCPDFKNREWWVCGPPAMVEAVIQLGQKMGVEEKNIRSEEFSGY